MREYHLHLIKIPSHFCAKTSLYCHHEIIGKLAQKWAWLKEYGCGQQNFAHALRAICYMLHVPLQSGKGQGIRLSARLS